MLSASRDVAERLARELGVLARVEVHGDVLVLAPPHDVRCQGRGLRGSEHEAYASACLAAAASLPLRAVRYEIEEMYVFDWDAFGSAHWAALDAAYTATPEWLGTKQAPLWFGPNEPLGPCLWASVEPPGLQVGGTLELGLFEEWNKHFLERTAMLPVRPID